MSKRKWISDDLHPLIPAGSVTEAEVVAALFEARAANRILKALARSRRRSGEQKIDEAAVFLERLIKKKPKISESVCISRSIEEAICPKNPEVKTTPRLPLFNVEKVAKSVLPEKSQISETSILALQSCCEEFMMFVLGSAAEIVKTEGRKSVSCEDLLEAMRNLGVQSPSSKVLGLFIAKFREATVLAARGVLPDGPLEDRVDYWRGAGEENSEEDPSVNALANDSE